MSNKRKTLLLNENVSFGLAAVDDDEEKRRRVSERFDVHSSGISIQRKSRPDIDKNKTLTSHVQASKPSNEQLSHLYNNCVKLLNENKINVKNAFQLKLIDYMGDIVLNKEISGGDTNFQVVGCTIDVGTKIYAARVDALHQNTYQMLSGLGHSSNNNEDQSTMNTTSHGGMDDNEMENYNENDEQQGNKKAKQKKRRIKKSSQIAENLDSITSKATDDIQDEDLYFSKISTCIENEAVAGTLLNKLKFIDDSYQIYVNAEDKMVSTTLQASEFKHDNGIEISLKEIVEVYRAKSMDFRNLKLCTELSSFRFIGWNLETNDEISKLVESVSAPEEDLEMHKFDANNLNRSHLNISNQNVDIDVDEMINNDINFDGDMDNFEASVNSGSIAFQNHQAGLELIDDIRSLNSVADLTTLVSQAPNEYSYFDKFKMHNLKQNLRNLNNAKSVLGDKNNQEQVKTAATVRNKREAPRIDLGIVVDRMKFFKVTKKAIFLCDRTIEKRSEKALRLETERQYEFNVREFFQPYWKPISAKIYTLDDIDVCENLLMKDDEKRSNGNKNTNELDENENGRDNFLNDDDGHIGGIDDDFEIAGATNQNNQFFSTQGGEYIQSQQIELMGNNNYGLFDGDNLIEAPMQVNAINIDYAKTSKNIDVRRLKNVIWSLLSNKNDKQENIDDSFNNDQTKKSSSISINASLKTLYKALRPPLISQRVFDDLSICIVFQMLLFLANEHNLLLKNDPIGSDVIITNY